jgi:TolB protein
LVWAAARPAAQEELDLTKYATGVKRIAIAVSGYSGEVAKALKFDLEIAGFEFVGEERAQYLLKGGNNDQVEGRLSDAINKTAKFAKAYSGGSLRSQAHALADDVVEALTGRPGIARTKIAFKAQRGENSEIYIADYDGHNAVAVTQDNTIVAAPCWAPGQRKLYYTTYKFGNPDIIAHNLNTGERQLIARYSGLNTSAAVSPEGRRVAMILSKGGSPDVYVADADGGNLRQLTRTREDESSPCWSPDGRALCFATKLEGRRVLAKVSAEGGPVQRLVTENVANPSEPDWSPDGKLIAFTAQMGGFEICIVPAQGGAAKPLVAGEDPSWAPNSRTLVFARRVGGGKRVLSLLDVLTKETKNLEQSLGACSQPTWAR